MDTLLLDKSTLIDEIKLIQNGKKSIDDTGKHVHDDLILKVCGNKQIPAIFYFSMNIFLAP